MFVFKSTIGKPNWVRFRTIFACSSMAALAACATSAPPPPPAPQAQVRAEPIVIPARPTPPSGAVSAMTIPSVGSDGIRHTVNYNLTSAQKIWNMRSALNVAALNCRENEYASVLAAYKSLLTSKKRDLANANRDVGKEFRARFGSSARDEQDRYMTQVYNYFALPPAQHQFCTAATQIADEWLQTSPKNLTAFADHSLKKFETVFENFFQSYEQYRTNLAMWDARYGSMPGVSPASYNTNAVYRQAGEETAANSNTPPSK